MAWGRRCCLIALAVALALPGCASLQLVDRYDIEIETTVNKYHKDATKFLKADAAYTSKEAKAFYSTAAADLANAVVRAQVVAVDRTCAQPKFLDQIIGSIQSSRSFAGLPPLENATADVSLENGSCTVVALKALQANHARVEAVHKRNTTLGSFRSNLASGLIGDTVRIVLVIEAAKKS
jgi:hypothetical protein